MPAAGTTLAHPKSEPFSRDGQEQPLLPRPVPTSSRKQKELTHEAMRGPSAWSVGDRELMAAFVSKLNECEYCIRAHDRRRGEGVPGRGAGRCGAHRSRNGTHRGTVVDDMRTLLATGVSRGQIEDALAVAFAFKHDESAGRCLRVLGTWAEAVRGRCEIPPRARLSLTIWAFSMTGSAPRENRQRPDRHAQLATSGRPPRFRRLEPSAVAGLIVGPLATARPGIALAAPSSPTPTSCDACGAPFNDLEQGPFVRRDYITGVGSPRRT